MTLRNSIKAMGEESLVLTIYEPIGEGWFFEGLSAKTVRDALMERPNASQISVYINSEGGDVHQAVAIKTQLERHPARVVVNVDGVALSAASLVAMAGDEINMAKGAMLMIHEPWTRREGSADDFQHEADALNKVANEMAIAYAERARKPVEEVRAAMRAETWFTAQEAVEFGLADSVMSKPATLAQLKPGKFRNTPQALLQGRRQENRMDPKQLAEILGCKADELAITDKARALIAEAGELESATKRLAMLQSENAKLMAAVKAHNAEKLAGARDALIAALVKEGAIIPDGEREKLLRAAFDEGREDFATTLAASYREGMSAPPGGMQSRAEDRTAAGAGRTPTIEARPSGKLKAAELLAQLPASTRNVLGDLSAIDVFTARPDLLPAGVLVDDIE